MTPQLPEGEADLWSPVREEGYMCGACRLIESCFNNAHDADYEAFRNRWHDPIVTLSAAEHQASIDERNRLLDERDLAWTWPNDARRASVGDRASRDAQLADFAATKTYSHVTIRDGALAFERVNEIPPNKALLADVLARPNADEPREAYAHWLRAQTHPMAEDAALFVEAQLQLARAFRADPRADIKEQLPVAAFDRDLPPTTIPDMQWWRYPKTEGMGHPTRVLEDVGLVDDGKYFRGFVEHVAIKASRFLEIADELYSLVPIRQLTLTYCKGVDHDDTGLLRALLASPHLARIRGLTLPVRRFGRDKSVTVLNRLTDQDIEILAASPHLQGLHYLDLQDQQRLTVRAFDALASSPHLRSLSAVLLDVYDYHHPGAFSFGTTGKELRRLIARPLHASAAELEARHGPLPWLHVVENYGSESPDPEAVIEHPFLR